MLGVYFTIINTLWYSGATVGWGSHPLEIGGVLARLYAAAPLPTGFSRWLGTTVYRRVTMLRAAPSGGLRPESVYFVPYQHDNRCVVLCTAL